MSSSKGYFVIFFSILFFVSFSVFPQGITADQIEDYVILLNGRRFDGTIIRTQGQLDFEKIEFLRRGETLIYSPDDIRSFGLGTGEFFQSGIAKDTGKKKFFRLFLEGSIDVGVYNSNFYIGVEDEMVLLTESEKLNASSSGSDTSQGYKNVLASILAGDCGEKSSGAIRRTRLNQDDLVSLISNYLECRKQEYTLFTEFRPIYVLSPMVSIFTYQTGIKSNIKSGNRKDVVSSTPLIQGFVGMKVHSFRKYPKFGLESGISFETSTLTWDAQFISTTARYTGTEEVGIAMISIPLIISYNLIQTKNKAFFMGLGPGFGMSISNSDFSIQDVRFGQSSLVGLEESSMVELKPSSFFLQGQAGISLKLKSAKEIAVAAKVRQLGKYYSTKVGTNTAVYDKIDLGIGLSLLF